MNWIAGIVLGFISGITTILPVSSAAHEVLFGNFLGIRSQDPILEILLDAAVLIALFSGCRRDILRIQRERSSVMGRKNLVKRQLSSAAMATLLVMALLAAFTDPLDGSLLRIAFLLLLNGLILYLPSRLPQGNKDHRNFSPLDSYCVGIGAGLEGLSGLSGMAGALSAAQIRGTDRQYTLTLSFLLCIVSQGIALFLDIIGLATASASQHTSILTYIVSTAACFGGTRVGITVLRHLAFRIGFSGFSSYCWGAGLLSFILYLSI
jgi:undecaprenyl-diphosphatase